MPDTFVFQHLNGHPIKRSLRTAPWARRCLRPVPHRVLFGRAWAAGGRVLRHPARALERYALLNTLHRQGLGAVQA